MTEKLASKQALVPQLREVAAMLRRGAPNNRFELNPHLVEAERIVLAAASLLADEPAGNPPCIYRGGCIRADCTEHCMGFRREAQPPSAGDAYAAGYGDGYARHPSREEYYR